MARAHTTSSKVITSDQLLRRRKRADADNRVVVQCHGCFDIVHPGHVRHLQHAAKLGDILLVTITGDGEMTKGDGRPLIPQDLRAENLAALNCVDWVYIDPHPTAARMLNEIRPDVYVKGREYETNDDPRFRAERESVEKHGGRVVFSSGDVVFSSTALIAAMQQSADPSHARIRELADTHNLTPDNIEPLIASFRGVRICVVGQTIIDTYVICDRPEVAGESPVMSLRPIEWRSYDGGAAIIARHLAAMGAHPILITALPRTTEAEALRRRLLAEGVETRAIDVDSPLAQKQRYLVGAQKVMKVDLIEPTTLDATMQAKLITLAEQAASECVGAIIADYGHDLLTPATVEKVARAMRPHVNVLAGDISGRRSSLLSMREMDLICPSEHELRSALNDFDDGLSAVVWRALEQTRSRSAIVTMGEDGLIAFDRISSSDTGAVDWRARIAGEHIPSLVPNAIDPLGCGDSLLAAAALTLTRSGNFIQAAALGSIAAAAQAQRLGNFAISAADLRRGVARLSDATLAVTARAESRAPSMTLVS